jgi:short subunit fatty acids transporter
MILTWLTLAFLLVTLIVAVVIMVMVHNSTEEIDDLETRVLRLERKQHDREDDGQ